MKKLKRLTILLAAIVSTGHVFATDTNNSALSLPGYFGSINNNTPHVLECSQVIGGYCANNPMPANGYIQMLPDPGSKEIRGHLMIYQKNVPGKYLDNIDFVYSQEKDGQWKFTTYDLYKQIDIQAILPDTLLFNVKDKK